VNGADPPSGLGPWDGFAYLAGVVGWAGACVPEGVELELEVLGVLLLSASELDFSEAAFATRAAIMTGHPVRFNIRPISAREAMSLRIDISGFSHGVAVKGVHDPWPVEVPPKDCSKVYP
jgi:hypothetical protein